MGTSEASRLRFDASSIATTSRPLRGTLKLACAERGVLMRSALPASRRLEALSGADATAGCGSPPRLTVRLIPGARAHCCRLYYAVVEQQVRRVGSTQRTRSRRADDGKGVSTPAAVSLIEGSNPQSPSGDAAGYRRRCQSEERPLVRRESSLLGRGRLRRQRSSVAGALARRCRLLRQNATGPCS